jgi:hypothetical protein
MSTIHTTESALEQGFSRTTIVAFELATGISLGETDPWPTGTYSEIVDLEAIHRGSPLDATIGDLARDWLNRRLGRLNGLRQRRLELGA